MKVLEVNGRSGSRHGGSKKLFFKTAVALYTKYPIVASERKYFVYKLFESMFHRNWNKIRTKGKNL